MTRLELLSYFRAICHIRSVPLPKEADEPQRYRITHRDTDIYTSIYWRPRCIQGVLHFPIRKHHRFLSTQLTRLVHGAPVLQRIAEEQLEATINQFNQ